MTEAEFFLTVFAMVGATLLAWPLVRALGERIRPRQGGGASREELQALREEVVQELQQMRRDVAELSERVDFAERLLARQRDAERLAPPGH
jgi:hypothetical protein